jgi:hypothetical protein
MMKNRILIISIIFFILLSISCKKEIIQTKKTIKNLEYAGLRASVYGIKPFPQPEKWVEMIKTMANYFPNSKPVVVWIVGIVKDKVNCRLHFPSEGKSFKNIVFDDNDLSEDYLNYFDENNIAVFLQVEPANADVDTLIELVLKRYGQHKSVVGFGIDVEWYRENQYRGWGKKVDDKTAKHWEEKVKSYNPNYKVFIKHWDLRWMPEHYRGELIFIDDSQEFKNFSDMKKEFAEWGKRFYPNRVWFQIGYPKDKKWWEKYDNPPKYLGREIASEIKQKVGILWVDFTLKELFY